MSEDKKPTQQELMRRFLEEKKGLNNQKGQGVLRPDKNGPKPKTNTKVQPKSNGGGFFDK